ncbi:hypothetical protein D3C75_1114190 [compost metagenome]
MATQAEKIETLKAEAVAKYNKGYDVFVECYGQAEWVELMDDCKDSIVAARKLMRELVEARNEQASNCRFGDEF